MAEAFRNGGIWMYLILLMVLVTGPWLLLQAVLGALGKRLPAALWWIGPSLIAVIGLLGTGTGMSEALAAVESASPENRQMLLAMGLSISLNTVAFASMVNAAAGGTIALGAGVTNVFGAGEEAEFSPIPAGSALAVTVVGSLGLVGWVVAARSMGLSGVLIGVTLLFGGIGCALAGFKTDEGSEPDDRRVSDRIVAAAGTVFGVAFAGVAAVTLGFIEIFQALESVGPGKRDEMMARGVEMLWQVGYVGIAGTIAALVIGAIVVLAVGGRVMSRPVLIDAATCALVLLPVLGAFGYVASVAPSFQSAFEKAVVESEPPGD